MKKLGLIVFPVATICFALMLSLSSCGGDHEASSGVDTSAVSDEQATPEVFFQVPLPGEFYGSLKALGVKSVPNIQNPISNISGYTTSAEKALNFGVYSSDLFYCSTFDQKADVLKYFDNLKRLADDLGISSVVTENTMKRIENNLSKQDSLNAITNEIFYSATQALESNGQGATLALVIAGGLTESIYISTRLVSTYKDGSAAIQLIADQKFPLDNLFGYFAKYPEDARIAQVTEKIAPLRNIYNSLAETPKVAKQSSDGRKVIGSETLLMVNATDYAKISETATSVRNSIIQPTTK
jgi:hypothetical protein